MEETIDDLYYLLGRKTAEVERYKAISIAQTREIERLTALAAKSPEPNVAPETPPKE